MMILTMMVIILKIMMIVDIGDDNDIGDNDYNDKAASPLSFNDDTLLPF